MKKALAVLRTCPMKKLIFTHVANCWHGDGEKKLMESLKEMPFPCALAHDGDTFHCNTQNGSLSMSLRIAAIADTHLSNVPSTAQEAAFEFALKQLQSNKPDVVLVLGDLTAAGTIETAERARAMLEQSGLCFRMVPGNSDERTPAHCAAVAERLTVDTPFYTDDYAVCLLDAPNGTLSPRAKDQLKTLMETAGDRPIILGSHYPLAVCMKDPYVESLIEAENVSLFIGAHVHRDQERRIGKMAVHTVRGLDPDKANGGPPAVALFEFIDQQWSTDLIPFEDGAVTNWSPAMRQEFIDHLGFSCMSKSLEALDYASLHDVRCVELRAPNALSVPIDELLKAVRRWRDSGGTYLSIHMPDLGYDSGISSITGIPDFRKAVSLALSLGVDHMLLHVPRVPVGQMCPGSDIWGALADTFLDLIKEPMATGTIVGVENLHMNPDESDDGSRGFGYLPEECLEWVKSLRRASGYDHIGIHLDIGHARNNQPFSKECSVGQWYARVGKETVGYHLHQVVLVDGVMKNHHPILDIHGPLISLSSFFWGWKTGGLRHAPMFLEIRSDNIEDTVDSLHHIRRHIRGELSN